MNTQFFPRVATIAASVMLASLAQAQAATTASVSAARADCAEHKAKVHRLEARSTDLDNDPQLIRARQAWEMACVKASRLMVQAGIETPPVKPEPGAEARAPVLSGPPSTVLESSGTTSLR